LLDFPHLEFPDVIDKQTGFSPFPRGKMRDMRMCENSISEKKRIHERPVLKELFVLLIGFILIGCPAGQKSKVGQGKKGSGE
jgi:hypothetical protein